MKAIVFVVAVSLALSAGPAAAHSGRTNAEGCHNERATGGYHCHGTKRAPRKVDYLTAGSEPARTRSVSYRNCSAARAAGAAPVYRGDPGYGRHLDRDGDGVGCE
jgi:hypothetical protein